MDKISVSIEQIENATTEELVALSALCNKEIQVRRDRRRDELICNFIDAVRALRKEFPGVTVWREYENGDDFDIMDYLDCLTLEDFK